MLDGSASGVFGKEPEKVLECKKDVMRMHSLAQFPCLKIYRAWMLDTEESGRAYLFEIASHFAPQPAEHVRPAKQGQMKCTGKKNRSSYYVE